MAEIYTCTENTELQDDNIDKDSSFILKKNKTTGNYSILKKCIIKTNDSSNVYKVQRVKYIAYNAFIPFGKEEYNDNLILNVVINDSSNINHNLITTLKKIIDTFEELKNTEQGISKYLLNNKTFFKFMKEITCDKDDSKKYNLRLYLKYGLKITHASLIGELNYDQLKGKYCNIDFELGCMWINSISNMYGINIYISRLSVLN